MELLLPVILVSTICGTFILAVSMHHNFERERLWDTDNAQKMEIAFEKYKLLTGERVTELEDDIKNLRNGLALRGR